MWSCGLNSAEYCDRRLIHIKFLDAALEPIPFTLVSISRDLHDVVFPYNSVFPLKHLVLIRITIYLF
jgi:hypothetical protein